VIGGAEKETKREFIYFYFKKADLLPSFD